MAFLPSPVHTLTDFQAEFNGVLLGTGTPFKMPMTWRFFDMAALKTMDEARDWADGSFSGPDFADVLLPQLDLNIRSNSQAGFAAAMAQARGLFAPQAAPLPLWVKVPGFAPIGIPAKVNQRALPIPHAALLMSQGSIQFRCPDPAWQSAPRSVTLAASGSITSGLVFPVFAPASGTYTPPNSGADFGSTVVASSGATLTNSGNSPAWPVVVVSGPCPSFTINLDGNLVSYGQAIPAGQTLTVDYKTGTAILTGDIDRTAALTARAFTPVTLSSSVFFTASTGSAVVTIADVSR